MGPPPREQARVDADRREAIERRRRSLAIGRDRHQPGLPHQRVDGRRAKRIVERCLRQHGVDPRDVSRERQPLGAPIARIRALEAHVEIADERAADGYEVTRDRRERAGGEIDHERPVGEQRRSARLIDDPVGERRAEERGRARVIDEHARDDARRRTAREPTDRHQLEIGPKRTARARVEERAKPRLRVDDHDRSRRRAPPRRELHRALGNGHGGRSNARVDRRLRGARSEADEQRRHEGRGDTTRPRRATRRARAKARDDRVQRA
ncbi:MAG: hypothetical protein ACHREM_24225, partial [Polyangiales bacterium]